MTVSPYWDSNENGTLEADTNMFIRMSPATGQHLTPHSRPVIFTMTSGQCGKAGLAMVTTAEIDRNWLNTR